jgi:hypothetical protein
MSGLRVWQVLRFKDEFAGNAARYQIVLVGWPFQARAVAGSVSHQMGRILSLI